jgi:oxygen-dependent protoporphyrinogen oxidase
MTMQRTAVIGAGIAGLTVALRRAAAGDQVVVFEAASKVGGQLISEVRDGFVIEHGAEGFVARSEGVPVLAAVAGIADHIVEQLEHRSFRFDGSTLIELAPGEAGRLLGFQVPSDALGRGIRSFRHGMGELPERLASALRSQVELRLGTPVKSVAPRSGGGLVLGVGEDEQAFDFDGVVIATTARSASALLGDAFGPSARALRESSLVSSLTVNLVYRRDVIRHPLDGTGFIVDEPAELDGVRAVTFCSNKLPHRSPSSHALLRVFFRPNDHDLHALPDSAWAERTERALSGVLTISGSAEQAVVSRWPSALPVVDAAHGQRVARLEAALLGHRIWLAGAAFHGSGIDAAIRSAENAAQSIAGHT